ncbi:MAG: biotin/lipoyl-binding protein [Clostridiales bacterium]|jgi:biotin carboxyl carrier protein|nr:biotin/lipoyl-binding protein [Clostridiales bacterium]
MTKKYIIKVNGNAYEVEVEEQKGGAAQASAAAPVVLAAAPAAAPIQPAQAAQPAQPAPVLAPAAPKPAAPAAGAPAGATQVTSPMPGTILKIVASVGDDVKRGQVIVVLEAMKMENDIVAPSDGKVASINVAQGAAVNAGDLLASLS